MHEIENSKALSIVQSIVEKYGVNKDYNFLLRATGKELFKVKNQKKSRIIKKDNVGAAESKKLAKNKGELVEKDDSEFDMNDKIKGFEDIL